MIRKKIKKYSYLISVSVSDQNSRVLLIRIPIHTWNPDQGPSINNDLLPLGNESLYDTETLLLGNKNP